MNNSFDVIVVGSGPGGYVCAIRSAQLGLKTACVESRKTLGGTCLNVGCIPSKSLLNSSEMFHKAQKQFNSLGIETNSIKLNLSKMMSNKDKSVLTLTKGVEFLFKKNKVVHLKGEGSISEKNTVVVAEGSGKKTNYKANENKQMVKSKNEIDKNIALKNFKVVDARSLERFEGKVVEPRKGLRSGSIKNSFCLPFSELINEDHTFVSKDKIRKKFDSFKFDHNKNIVFSCGSGVTASVLALAYSLINVKYMPTIYDGSWSEYGKY